MFEILEGYQRHIPRTKTCNKISLCKSGSFGVSQHIVEKYELRGMKSASILFNPSKKESLVLEMFPKETPQGTAFKIKDGTKCHGIITAFSFVKRHPEYVGVYEVADCQTNAITGNIILLLKKRA